MPLPHSDKCRIHIPEGRLLKHRMMAVCFKNTEIWIRCRDVEVASQCSDMELILTVEDGEDTIVVLALFKYLGRPMSQSYYELLAVRRTLERRIRSGAG